MWEGGREIKCEERREMEEIEEGKDGGEGVGEGHKEIVERNW